MLWIDNAKILAIIAVVILHVAGAGLVTHGDIATTQWWIANLYDSAMRWAVPVFVMASGAVLLDPAKDESLRDFYNKRARRILVPLLFWTTFYLGWSLLKAQIRGQPITAADILIAVMRGYPYYHMWFLYMIAGMYLFTPFFRIVARHSSPRQLAFLAALLLGLAAANALWSQGDGNALFSNRFISYIPYFFLGYVLAIIPLELVRRHRSALFAGFIVGFLITALGYWKTTFDLSALDGYFYKNLSLNVMAMAVCVFMLVRLAQFPFKNHLMARKAANLSFGVYLVHPAILDVLTFKQITGSLFNPAFAIPLLAAVVLLIALVLTYIAKKIPLLKLIC
ncbi:acyltransferase [Amantichitinum ursilacus]|uniref:Inner membrane protein YiaH n=1 Tax=Amantichitinum ursilacus TaxID=857265 RepID=A0A0N1JRX5_9NEIS|nr:acyltransferase family protein [Amantichitinum ursilacus]KPC50296.1 Inner membrane protein YiaH [Amantichitinum ursilacus]